MLRHLSEAAARAASLPPDSARVLWARAMAIAGLRDHGHAPAALGAGTADRRPDQVPGGNSPPSIREIERKGLQHVADALNRDQKTLRKEPRAAEQSQRNEWPADATALLLL